MAIALYTGAPTTGCLLAQHSKTDITVDLIDLAAVRDNGVPGARQAMARAVPIDHHIFNHFIALAREFTGILAPAGVTILREMLRFERGVRISPLSRARLGSHFLKVLTEDFTLLRVEGAQLPSSIARPARS